MPEMFHFTPLFGIKNSYEILKERNELVTHWISQSVFQKLGRLRKPESVSKLVKQILQLNICE